MKQITLQAYGKINLTLDILRKREDGYHDVAMVMQSITLADSVTLARNDSGTVTTQSNLDYVPNDDRNIVIKAAKAFFAATEMAEQGVHITVHKRIPVAAGLAGGSTDGAAVIRGLNRLFARNLPQEKLVEIGGSVGTDIPFCLMGGTALAERKGDALKPLCDAPDFHVVLCKPPFSVSTPKVYGAFQLDKVHHHPDTGGMLHAIEMQDQKLLAKKLYNVFEPLVSMWHPQIKKIKVAMLENGAKGAMMSGSGPTVFGLFPDLDHARRVEQLLRKSYQDVFLCGFAKRAESNIFTEVV